jgi:3-oxoacyl-[acyl-carrier-protein] synthase III
LLRSHGLTIDDIDLIVPHQPNVRILDAVLQGLGASPERCVLTADRLGNMASASLPVSLAMAMSAGRLPPGKLALFLAYGAGATWGAALYRS